ncbi:MAG: PP2C family protein-serine/threonine phosphatase [Bacteroidetes bacterium]|nr:PP2C family protein-serine/threonine phosphatase [Bacteroidota bacterium]
MDVPLRRPTAFADPLGLATLDETSRLVTDDALDTGFLLSNLLLTAMSRALTARAVAALRSADGSGYAVAVQKGLPTLDGQMLAPDDLDLGDGGSDVPGVLADHGLALALPLRFGAATVGFVALGPRLTRQPYGDDDLRFLRSLVSMTAPALQNARTLDRLRHANAALDAQARTLAQQVQRLETLLELAQALAATPDRTAQLRLLGFTLMGQTTARRYALLVEPPARPSSLDLSSIRGFAADTLDPASVRDAVADREDPFVPSPEEPLGQAGVALVCPLGAEGRVVGVLLVGPRTNGQPYDDGDRALVEAIGRLALTAIRTGYLLDEQAEKRRMDEEMRIARSIQERLLPQSLPPVPGAELAVVALPSRAVGGDLYDALTLPDGRIFLAVADVTGKGVPASLLMANLQACLHVLYPDGLASLPDAAARANRVICENTSAATFITAFFALYDPQTHVLRYVNAGHNPPYIVREDGSVDELTDGGLILGVMKGMAYDEGEATLAPGDVLAMFSDGVTEAMGDAQEEYGEDRLIAVLRATRNEPAAAVVARVQADVEAFTGPVAQRYDDFTLVVLHREG